MPLKQIFDPTDPHQYLLFLADDGTRNDANQAIPTNVRSLFDLVEESGNSNVRPIYISGVGTEHDLGGLNSALGLGAGLQVTQTLEEINRRVNRIITSDPDANFVFAGTSFSRGSGVLRAVANILLQQGVPDFRSARDELDGDGGTRTVYDRSIVAPGAANIGALMLYDTVTTGLGSLYRTNIPSQVTQTLHLTAQNEYRDFFPLTSALSSPGAANESTTELMLPGAHTSIGGGSYDRNGIGAANLELGYTFLQRVGVPLAPLPSTMRPDPSQFVIYDSRWARNGSLGSMVNNPNMQRTIKYGR